MSRSFSRYCKILHRRPCEHRNSTVMSAMAGLSQVLVNSVRSFDSEPRNNGVRSSPIVRKSKLKLDHLQIGKFKMQNLSDLSYRGRGFSQCLMRVTCCSGKDGQDISSGSTGPVVEERPGKILESSQKEYLRNIEESEESSLSKWLYPSKELLPDDKEMSIFDHLEELRQRIFMSVLAVGAAMLICFLFSKDLIIFLEAPVSSQGVRFLQLSPGEFFFTTLKVSGYCGLLLGSPIIIYEIIAFVIPGLTRNEKKFLGPIVLGSSVLFYAGLVFSYAVLTPAALNFFVSYAEGAVESLWSIDQYFEFVLVLMFSTGLAFQVPVIQLLLGQTRLVTGDQMLSVWRYVVVGSVIAAAVLTPSTDPLTQVLLAGPLIGLYLGGAWVVKLTSPPANPTQ